MSRRSVAIWVCVAAILVAAATPWALPSGRFERQIKREVRDAFGLDAEVTGRATVALLPTPRLKFAGARLRAPDGTVLVEAAQLRGELRVSALLLGRVELSEVSLANGRIDLEPGETGLQAWLDPARRALARYGDETGPSLRRIVLNGMSVAWGRGDRSRELRAVNAVAALPSRQGEFGLVGSAVWRGQNVDLSVTEIDTTALKAGRPSNVAIRFQSAPIQASVRGRLTWSDGPEVAGTFSAELPSVRGAVGWQGWGETAPNRPLSATGTIAASRSGIELSGLRATFGKDTVDGALSFQQAQDRPTLRATLAADALDLGEIGTAAFGRAMDAPAALLGELTRLDLDLRVSATSATVGSLRLGDLALSALTGAGRIDVGLGRASLGGGALQGRFTATQEEGGWDLRQQMTLSQVDFARAPLTIGTLRIASGLGDGQLAAQASGASPALLFERMSGALTLSVENGALVGLTLPDGQKTPLTAGNGSRTAFGRMQATVRLVPHAADILQATIDTAASRTEINGTVTVPEGDLSLAFRTGGPAWSGTPPSVTTIGGTWWQPRITSATPAR